MKKSILKQTPKDRQGTCYNCGETIALSPGDGDGGDEAKKSKGIATKGFTVQARKFFCSKYCKDRWNKSDSGE